MVSFIRKHIYGLKYLISKVDMLSNFCPEASNTETKILRSSEAKAATLVDVLAISGHDCSLG